MCVTHNFFQTVAMNMATLRDQGLYCDLEIECEGQAIKAHKIVMAAAIDYFRHMLNSRMLESLNNKVQLTVIHFPGLKYDALKVIVDFAYSGHILLTEGNAADVLQASNFLLVEDVQESCVDFLLSNLTLETVFRTKQLAYLTGSERLHGAVDEFVLTNFMDLHSSPQIGVYDLEDLVPLLSSHRVRVRSENEILNAIVKWTEFDLDVRLQDLPQLLEVVRVDQLKSDVMAGVVPKQVKHMLVEWMESKQSTGPSSSSTPTSLSRYYASGVLVCIGGRREHPTPCEFVEVYSPYDNVWKWTSEVPFAGRQVGVTVIGHRVYLVGGHNGRRAASSSGVLDARTMQYSFLPPLPRPHRGMGVTQLQDRYVYALGGTDEDNESYRDAQRFDTLQNRWEAVAPMIVGRRNVNAMTVGSTIYAIGGCTVADSEPSSSVECYDAQEDRWSEAPSMNTARYSGGAAVLSNRLYVVGGFGRNGALRDCEYLDTETGIWHQVAPLNTARGGVGIDFMGGRLFAVGGYNGEYLKSAEVYDPIADQWHYCASMLDPRAGCGVAHVDLLEDQVASMT